MVLYIQHLIFLKCVIYFLYRLNIFYVNSWSILFEQLNFIPSKSVILFQVNNFASKRFLVYWTADIHLFKSCSDTCDFVRNLVM